MNTDAIGSRNKSALRRLRPSARRRHYAQQNESQSGFHLFSSNHHSLDSSIAHIDAEMPIAGRQTEIVSDMALCR
jgi:hypothetical protein